MRLSVAGLGALLGLAFASPVFAAGPFDGSYEYASPGWIGSLQVETGADNRTYFAMSTEKGAQTCALIGSGVLNGDTLTYVPPNGGGALTLRFFPSNAEAELPGGPGAFCSPQAQIGGIYIKVGETPQLDRDLRRRTQAALNKLGYDAGAVDGVIGQRTRLALTGFQRAEGLPATGAASLQTLEALEAKVLVATGGGLPDRVPVQTPAPDLDWLRTVPRAYIAPLDTLYADAVAPARIDYTNPPFDVALVDLDEPPGAGPDAQEILVFWNDARFCGAEGCQFEVLKRRGADYTPIFQIVADSVALGESSQNGMRDIVIDGDAVYRWTGKTYETLVYVPVRVR